MRRWATFSIPPEDIGDRVPTNVVLECLHISLGDRVCQPLYLLRCADVAKPLLDTVDYHFPDLLAGNRGCCGYLVLLSQKVAFWELGILDNFGRFVFRHEELRWITQ